jgi:hypothetical protein
MKTREEAARFVERLMDEGVSQERKRAWHFGKVELRDLFDFIYEGPPTKPEEDLFEPLRLRNAKVGKWRD